MFSTKQLQLLEAWKTNLASELSLAEIMKISHKKTKPWVFNTVKQLTQQKLLISKRKSNLDLYSLNLRNPFLLQTIHYLKIQPNLSFPLHTVIEQIISTTPIHTYCLLVFGSYAQGKQQKNSDLDLCFLVEDTTVEKKLKPYINELKLNFSVSIDEHYITFDDFIKMLLHPEENLGKQITRKQIIFYNPDIYYQLLKEAYQHGFRP